MLFYVGKSGFWGRGRLAFWACFSPDSDRASQLCKISGRTVAHLRGPPNDTAIDCMAHAVMDGQSPNLSFAGVEPLQDSVAGGEGKAFDILGVIRVHGAAQNSRVEES